MAYLDSALGTDKQLASLKCGLTMPSCPYCIQHVAVAEVLEALGILEIDHKERLEVEEVDSRVEVAHLWRLRR